MGTRHCTARISSPLELSPRNGELRRSSSAAAKPTSCCSTTGR